jgi:uncharacterized protein YndB with AHSA1/START domain
MNPQTSETHIDRPQSEVFSYLADISLWPEWTDHFLVGWHLTREDPYGQGAGARFHVERRLDRFAQADLTFHEVVPPRRIHARGRSGKYNRTRWIVELEVEPEGSGTLVRLRVVTAPGLPTDRLMEAVTRTSAFHRRRWSKALERLRSILEDGEERGHAATISGGARKPATGSPIRAA